MSIIKKVKEKIVKSSHWKIVAALLLVFDFVAIYLSYLFALILRFDLKLSQVPKEYLRIFSYSILPYTFICLIIFFVLNLYKFVWQHVGIYALLKIIMANAITFVVNILETVLIFGQMPAFYYIVGIACQFILTSGIRFSYRAYLYFRESWEHRGKEAVPVMIIGAGAAGLSLIKNLEVAKEINEKVICVIDDNPNKQGRFVGTAKVVGDRNDIMKAASDYGIKKIYLAIPSASIEEKRDILNICKETGCQLRSVKNLSELKSADVSITDVRDVSIEDLLGREQVKVDLTSILEMLRGKVVLITGAGGSIGSELSRQIASHKPQRLILFDIYENGVYDVQLELKKKYPWLDLKVLIGSVRDSRKMLDVFKTYRPDYVYHAAAHKHVPLMEDSPAEAIKNNVLGTYKTALAASVYGCEKFTLISTDKAVNPVNIMGASKRMCEMVIQGFDYVTRLKKLTSLVKVTNSHNFSDEQLSEINKGLAKSRTKFVAVRFGNVLGSNGSVIPIFKRQIAEGGPVTVTHPDIIRYFMTIPEAVSLVLQTSVYAEGGDICVLDMGEPVKIDTLARNMIRLSGLRPDIDIKIEYTGLRPGEKLYEERLMAEEGLKETPNKMISVARPIEFDMGDFFKGLGEMQEKVYCSDEVVRSAVMKMVDTYHPAAH